MAPSAPATATAPSTTATTTAPATTTPTASAAATTRISAGRARRKEDAGGRHFELLLRLKNQSGGIVSPAEFIPPAERYGLMPLIDRWVVRNAFRQLAAALTMLAHLAYGDAPSRGPAPADHREQHLA